ncbi:MAG: lycopene cyclase family protein, partial [Flavobacteriaceae bacterium]
MKDFDYIIAGGGASGLQLAYRMAQHPVLGKASILILEKNANKQNDRTWCFWEDGDGEWDDLLQSRWNAVQFNSPTHDQKIDLKPLSYKMIRSASWYDHIYKSLHKHPNIELKYESVMSFKEVQNGVEVTTSKSQYVGQLMFNSILDWDRLTQQQDYPVLQQHFLGWFVRTKAPVFDPETATFMDFDIPQNGHTRFMYVLPVSATEALIEYTLFSKELLPKDEYKNALHAYLADKNITEYEVVEEEFGRIPMTCYPFSQHNTRRLLHIGSAGGWTKASTGFTFQNINRKTQALVAHLAENKPLKSFNKKNRFWFYDLLFLDVLAAHNSRGAALFSRMFQKNKPEAIFSFLDDKSSWIQELNIMRSFPTWLFVK